MSLKQRVIKIKETNKISWCLFFYWLRYIKKLVESVPQFKSFAFLLNCLTQTFKERFASGTQHIHSSISSQVCLSRFLNWSIFIPLVMPIFLSRIKIWWRGRQFFIGYIQILITPVLNAFWLVQKYSSTYNSWASKMFSL